MAKDFHPAKHLANNSCQCRCRLFQKTRFRRLLPLLIFQATTMSQALIIGTLNGYDIGGDDAICWESKYNEEAEKMPSDVVEFNQIILAEETASYTLVQKPTCYSGTNFSIAHVGHQTTIFSGGEIALKFYLTTSLTEIEQALVEESKITSRQPLHHDNVTVWFRLLECNARKIGFCNPFIDINDWDEEMDLSVTDAMPDDTHDDPFDYQEGGALFSIPSTGTKHIFSSRWIRSSGLTKSKAGDNAFDTSLIVNFVIPDEAVGIYSFIGKFPMSRVL